MRKLLILLSAILVLFASSCVSENPSEDIDDDPNKGNQPIIDNGDIEEYKFMERTIKTDGQTYTDGDVKYPASLWQTPEYEYDDTLTNFNSVPDGVQGLFYTSVTYYGKPTKVAAYIGFPEGASADNKCPAIVLVHGGLGTAIPDWVKYWNNLGFAAISMDTEGGEPIEGVCNNNNVHNERNRYENDSVYAAGPTNKGFGDTSEALVDQWMYHATSSVIAATSLISSFECVDTRKIGMTGVSWGSDIASIVVGYDDRVSFCMPIYGALSLNESCSGFATIYGGNQTQIDRWDHLNAIKNTNCKMFYVTSTTDFAYSMDAASRTSKAAGGFVLYKKSFSHGQLQAAEEENIPFFAKYFCGMESEFVEILQNPTREDPTLKIRTYGDVTINSIKIFYTDAKKTNQAAQWESKKVGLVEGLYEYYLNIPDSTYCYIQITYNNNLQVSSYIF